MNVQLCILSPGIFRNIFALTCVWAVRIDWTFFLVNFFFKDFASCTTGADFSINRGYNMIGVLHPLNPLPALWLKYRYFYWILRYQRYFFFTKMTDFFLSFFRDLWQDGPELCGQQDLWCHVCFQYGKGFDSSLNGSLKFFL